MDYITPLRSDAPPGPGGGGGGGFVGVGGGIPAEATMPFQRVPNPHAGSLPPLHVPNSAGALWPWRTTIGAARRRLVVNGAGGSGVVGKTSSLPSPTSIAGAGTTSPLFPPASPPRQVGNEASLGDSGSGGPAAAPVGGAPASPRRATTTCGPPTPPLRLSAGIGTAAAAATPLTWSIGGRQGQPAAAWPAAPAAPSAAGAPPAAASPPWSTATAATASRATASDVGRLPLLVRDALAADGGHVDGASTSSSVTGNGQLTPTGWPSPVASGGGGGTPCPSGRDARMDIRSLLSPASTVLDRAAVGSGATTLAAATSLLSAATPTEAALAAVATIGKGTGAGGGGGSSSGGGRHPCPVCGRALSTRANLARHVRVLHLKQTAHACTACPAAFLYRCQLALHVRSVHLRLRPYACPVGGCSKAFATRGHAAEHARLVHAPDREMGGEWGATKGAGRGGPWGGHECGVCGKRCRTRAGVAMHIRTAHEGDRPHVCGVCGRAFGYASHRRRHERDVHNLGGKE
ncbi:hypothetical protein MMPV_000562 [Pyropia vietnamensis]